MHSKTHWEHIYARKTPEQLSWFQPRPALSLGLIQAAATNPEAPIIDVGGGASTLVDELLARGYRQLTVLDLSAAALGAARARLGNRASAVHWLEADICRTTLPAGRYEVWHDRAVFHFLTTPAARQRYVQNALRAVQPGGQVVIATFALDGPRMCSGLPVARYSAPALSAELGDAFRLLHTEPESHRTPAGGEQKFIYCCFRREG